MKHDAGLPMFIAGQNKKVRYRQLSANRKKFRLCPDTALQYAKRLGNKYPLITITVKGLFLGLLVISFIPCQATAIDNPAQLSDPNHTSQAREAATVLITGEAQPAAVVSPKRANFD